MSGRALRATQVFVGHRVVDAPAADDDLAQAGTLTTEEVERFLRTHEGWTWIGPGALLEAPREGGPGRLLLSFDDGYRDVAERVLPLLELYRAPCLLFVVTGFVEGSSHPYEAALAALLEARDAVRLPDGEEIVTPSVTARRDLHARLRIALKPRAPEERERFVEALARANGCAVPGPERSGLLDWRALRELDRHPLVTIGAHGERHAYLPALSAAEARREIHGAKLRLEDALGHPVLDFAYPYGASSSAVRRLVRAAGYRQAFITRPRRRDLWRRADRFAIPRRDLDGSREARRHAA